MSRNGDYLVELARLDRESSGVDQYPFITSNPTTTPIIGDIYTEPTEPIHLQQPRARGTPSSDSIIPVDGTGIRSAGVPPNVLPLSFLCVPLDAEGTVWSLGLCTVHLQQLEVTALEAALVHDPSVWPPHIRPVARGFVEVESSFATDELQSIHELGPAQGLWAGSRPAHGQCTQHQVEHRGARVQHHPSGLSSAPCSRVPAH